MLNETERKNTIDLLFSEECSCVIRNGDTIRIFRERGVRDLLRLLHEERGLLAGAFVADKVVGKGAAALMVLGGVRSVFADVISAPALELLEGARVRVFRTVEVPNIENRNKTGICPVEKLCCDCRTAEECLPLIEEFAASMSRAHKTA